MGADHSHASAGMRNRKQLLITLGLGISALAVQLVGGLMSGSLALLADSVHIFADVFGVALALVAVTVAARPTKPARTFGLYRLEILATVFNGMLLLVLSIFILYEAVQRWFEPEPINAWVVILAACYGLLANLAGVILLRRGSNESLAVRGAYLEVMSDAIGSAGVLVAGVVILATGWDRADVLVSIGIALFIIPRTLRLLGAALGILMEHAPADLDLEEVRRHMMEVDHVVAVHDLHAWTITSGMTSLSAHVTVEPDPYSAGSGTRTLQALEECVHDCFDIAHTTFQLESPSHTEAETPRHP